MFRRGVSNDCLLGAPNRRLHDGHRHLRACKSSARSKFTATTAPRSRPPPSAAAATATYTTSLAYTNNSTAQHAQGCARTLRVFRGEGNADVATVNVDSVSTVNGSLRKCQIVIDRIQSANSDCAGRSLWDQSGSRETCALLASSKVTKQKPRFLPGFSLSDGTDKSDIRPYLQLKMNKKCRVEWSGMNAAVWVWEAKGMRGTLTWRRPAPGFL